jgi:hypothetical protein
MIPNPLNEVFSLGQLPPGRVAFAAQQVGVVAAELGAEELVTASKQAVEASQRALQREQDWARARGL